MAAAAAAAGSNGKAPAASAVKKPAYMRGFLYYATTASNSAVAVAVMAALYRVRAGWLPWTVCACVPHAIYSCILSPRSRSLAVTMVPRFNRFSYHVMRWPLLALVYSIVGLELVLYVALRVVVRAMEMAIATPAHRELRRALAYAPDYASWLDCARALDASKGVALWQADLRSTRYNWPFVKGTIARLREGRANRDWRAVVIALRLCSRPNVAGIMAPQLFSATHTGEPKTVVTDFVEEIAASIQWLTKFALDEQVVRRESDENGGDAAGVVGGFLDPSSSSSTSSSSSSPLSTEVIIEDRFSCFQTSRELFAAARESYGRTVLSLSGGGALGTYHFGVVRALWSEDLLPDTVCGTSAGAIVAAFICTRNDVEIERDLMDDDALRTHLVCFDQSPLECVVHLFRNGVLYDKDRWLETSRWFANDSDASIRNITFLEAFQRSGRRLAITVCAKGKRAPPVLLTHLTSPHVVIASALVATAGVPGLIKPSVLLEKDPETGEVSPQAGGEIYIDGSIVHDIPTVGLKEAFNARFVVASQVNPHIVPMLYHTHGSAGDPSRWSSPRRSEDAWRGGFVVAAAELFLRNDMRAKLEFLREVDATPGWTGRLLTQNFEGSVTITPALRVRDYFELFKNPDVQSMPRFLREGYVRASPPIKKLQRAARRSRRRSMRHNELRTREEAAVATPRECFATSSIKHAYKRRVRWFSGDDYASRASL
ncbi:hypothetical protein CTAYLR_002281, partial [Chrysophaeum taylorii]